MQWWMVLVAAVVIIGGGFIVAAVRASARDRRATRQPASTYEAQDVQRPGARNQTSNPSVRSTLSPPTGPAGQPRPGRVDRGERSRRDRDRDDDAVTAGAAGGWATGGDVIDSSTAIDPGLDFDGPARYHDGDGGGTGWTSGPSGDWGSAATSSPDPTPASTPDPPSSSSWSSSSDGGYSGGGGGYSDGGGSSGGGDGGGGGGGM